MMRCVAASVAIFCLGGWAQQPACTIRGTVVDTAGNRPIVRARVVAEVRESHSFLRLTDARGGFCFEHLSPAAYRIAVQKAGYPEEQHGVTLTVEENSELKPLAIRMTAYASISGVVQNAGDDPLPGAEVRVWKRVREGSGFGQEVEKDVKADGNGAFHFSQLPPGVYYLSANRSDWDEHRFYFPFLDSQGQSPREKEVETFYSGSFTFAGAAPVQVTAGQKLDSLVLTLQKTRLRRVSGQIANSTRSSYLGIEETEAAWRSCRDCDVPIDIGRDGSFSREGLPPARYTLRLSEGNRQVARTIVDLTNGDVGGVTLAPIETLDVPVNFRMEGKVPAFRPAVGWWWGFLVDHGSGEEVSGRVVIDGTYQFEGVPRGVYQVSLSLHGQELYIKRIAYNGEALQAMKLDLRIGPPGALEVTLSPNVAEVRGRAVAPPDRAGGDATEEVTVILVDTAEKGETVPIAGQAGIDQKGRFEIKTVPPGKYKLFAIEGFDEDDWGSPELLKALSGKSMELELQENETKQVNVTVISSDEWEAALKKIGE